MMPVHAMPTPESLPSPRSRLPTIPFALDEYARLSCLPDADDDLVFEAGPQLATLTRRVPHVARVADRSDRLTRDEALLLSLVDGICPVSVLVEIVGGDEEEAMVAICDLYARGLVAFD
jgi:hypothetical protein